MYLEQFEFIPGLAYDEVQRRWEGYKNSFEQYVHPLLSIYSFSKGDGTIIVSSVAEGEHIYRHNMCQFVASVMAPGACAIAVFSGSGELRESRLITRGAVRHLSYQDMLNGIPVKVFQDLQRPVRDWVAGVDFLRQGSLTEGEHVIEGRTLLGAVLAYIHGKIVKGEITETHRAARGG